MSYELSRSKTIFNGGLFKVIHRKYMFILRNNNSRSVFIGPVNVQKTWFIVISPVWSLENKYVERQQIFVLIKIIAQL